MSVYTSSSRANRWHPSRATLWFIGVVIFFGGGLFYSGVALALGHGHPAAGFSIAAAVVLVWCATFTWVRWRLAR